MEKVQGKDNQNYRGAADTLLLQLQCFWGLLVWNKDEEGGDTVEMFAQADTLWEQQNDKTDGLKSGQIFMDISRQGEGWVGIGS